MVARSREDILAARGVKPTLSPNLSVLATVEALDVKRLLFIGVGCQVGSGRPWSLHHAPAQPIAGVPGARQRLHVAWVGT